MVAEVLSVVGKNPVPFRSYAHSSHYSTKTVDGIFFLLISFVDIKQCLKQPNYYHDGTYPFIRKIESVQSTTLICVG